MPDEANTPSKNANELITDLGSVANIVGSLGLSVAAAQKAFNLDYIHGLAQLVKMVAALAQAGGGKELDQFMKTLLLELAPSRYQFTETTIAVKLDLAQTRSVSGNVGLGVNIGAVALNASMSAGYSSDYRAAAEIRSVLHAIPMDKTTMTTLLSQADKLSSAQLPEGAEVDANIQKTAAEIQRALMGSDNKAGDKTKP